MSEQYPLSLSCQFVYRGDELKQFVSPSSNLGKRNCFAEVEAYINNKTTRKVLTIFGLRRTGKTTMMAQVIDEMPEDVFNKTCLFVMTDQDNFDSLYHDLWDLKKAGYKYFFIDEITALNDFVRSSSILANGFTFGGDRIILTGTNSLAFVFARKDQLYDRQIFVNTTNIPFAEYSRLLHITDLDTYIEYGGLLVEESENQAAILGRSPFATPSALGEYLNTAISGNILHSLKYSDVLNENVNNIEYKYIRELYRTGELQNVINRIVVYLNEHTTINNFAQITADAMASVMPNVNLLFSMTTDGVALKQLKPQMADITEYPHSLSPYLQSVLTNYLTDIGVRGKISSQITPEHFEDIERYLKEIGLISYIKIKDAEIIDIDESESIYQVNKKTNLIVINQPGMRYCITKAFIDTISEDIEGFCNYINNNLKVSIAEQNGNRKRFIANEVWATKIIDKILAYAKGKILEDIVLLEATNAVEKYNQTNRNFRYEVFKLKVSMPSKGQRAPEQHEFDLVFWDSVERVLSFFEIKHASFARESQQAHLQNPILIQALKDYYCPETINRAVLYRGDNNVSSKEISYYNIQDFLISLGNNPEQMLSNGLLPVEMDIQTPSKNLNNRGNKYDNGL